MRKLILNQSQNCTMFIFNSKEIVLGCSHVFDDVRHYHADLFSLYKQHESHTQLWNYILIIIAMMMMMMMKMMSIILIIIIIIMDHRPRWACPSHCLVFIWVRRLAQPPAMHAPASVGLKMDNSTVCIAVNWPASRCTDCQITSLLYLR